MADYEVEKKAEELLEAIGVELTESRAKYADDILSGKRFHYMQSRLRRSSLAVKERKHS